MPLISEPPPKQYCNHIVYCCYGLAHERPDEPKVYEPKTAGCIAICDRCDCWVFSKYTEIGYIGGYVWRKPCFIRFWWWKRKGKHELKETNYGDGKMHCLLEDVSITE